MQNKSLLFGLLLIITGPAKAADLFYGIALISQEVDTEVSSGGTRITETEDGSGIGLFADIYYQSTYRFNGTFSYVDYTDFYIVSLTASADYLIPIDDRFTLFGGVTAGGTGQVYSDSSFSDMAASHLTGVQIGGIMLAGDHLLVELGYRQRFIDLETEFSGNGTVVSIEDMSETYISLNLIF